MTAPKRILVTGGAGFIASHVADQLVAAGHDVAVVDNLSTGKQENVPAACGNARSASEMASNQRGVSRRTKLLLLISSSRARAAEPVAGGGGRKTRLFGSSWVDR